MPDKKVNPFFSLLIHAVWNMFASLRLTVVTLSTIALTCIIGTLIPQNQLPMDYLHAFGPYLYRIFLVLDLFDMYHSLWFNGLLMILTMNIIICSINRVFLTRKFLFTKTPDFHLDRFLRQSDNRMVCFEKPLLEIQAVCFSLLKEHFSYVRKEKSIHGVILFAEKGRWTRLGVYGVHLSFVLLILGGLIGSVFGFDGYVEIPEGSAVRMVHSPRTGEMIPLPFEIRCDDFSVSFYKNGTPREYRSDITIVENGKIVQKKGIIVNDPLRYKGINIFQSSYGKISKDERGGVFLDKTKEKIVHSHQSTQYYTGLQVTKNPGIPLIYSGFILMISGLMITFYLSHQQFCLNIKMEAGKGSMVLSGISNKNKFGMARKTEKIFERISFLVSSVPCEPETNRKIRKSL